MQINRNNYENFFLLYVDGELCAADRKAVEDFATENPDLQKELDILKETVLPAEEVWFEMKGELLRPIPVDANLQEKLLLKIDNELPQSEMVSLDELIAVDLNVKAEFDLLRSTKLNADEKIIFADKHLLYRKERDNVVIGRFVRWAAAAILIGFGLFFGVSLLNKKTPVDIARTIIKPLNKSNKGEQIVNPDQKATDIQITPEQATQSSKEGTNSPQNLAAVKKENTNGNVAVKKNDDQPAENNQPANEPVLVRNGNNLPERRVITDEPQQQLASVTAPEKKKINITDESIVPLDNPYAQTASFDADKSDNKILYMDEDAVKRSKAGGLFRKVKRFVERTAKIKTGNTLRIAGFEFASK